MVTAGTDPNVAPVGVNNTDSVNEGATLTRSTSAGVLPNDTDADGNTLTVTAVRTGAEGGSGTGGAGGQCVDGDIWSSDPGGGWQL